MTTSAPQPRRRRPSPRGVVLSAIALFLTVFTLLAVQLASGHDPALGAGTATAAKPRPVVVKRVVKRVYVVPETTDDGGYYEAPAQTYQPPAQTYQPAPAPAQAPLQTRAS